MTDTIIQRLGAIFVENLHIDAPSPETDLFEDGVLDSLQLVELLLQLERNFGARIAIENIDLENLRTLERIARLVSSSVEAESRTAQAPSCEVRRDKRLALRAVR